MIGITAIVSFVGGIISEVAPTILGEWKADKSQKREMQMLEHQVKITEKQVQMETEARVSVAQKELDAAEASAWAKASEASHVAFDGSLERLSKSGWLVADKFNGMIRPFYGLVAGLLVAYVAFMFFSQVTITADGALKMPLIVSLFIEGAIGYFLGGRGVSKWRTGNAS